MGILIHYKKKNLVSAIDQLVVLHQQYNQNTFGLEADLSRLLEETQAFFKQIGQSQQQSMVSKLSIYLQTALSGINPQTLEVVKKYRRLMIKTAVYHCLSSLSSLLEQELGEINALLSQSKKVIEQVMISAIQSHIITHEQIQKVESIQEVEKLWIYFKSKIEQVNTIHKKLLLDLLNQDIYLLLDEIIDSLKEKE